ncbi:MAG: helix-turn-helix transcriptional regulator [Chloroflexi bacterium]|nr:helix-turn-helix transcriptional regulator [Chloroflexota bacterium]
MPGRRASGTRRGRGRSRQGVMGFLRPALLFMLARENSHGYSLLDGLAEFGFNPDRVDPSMVYRTLKEMEEFGLVSSRLGEESLGPQRRIYQILPEGEPHLVEMIRSLRLRRDEIDSLLQAYDQEFIEK